MIDPMTMQPYLKLSEIAPVCLFCILSSLLEILMLYMSNREVMGLSLQFWCTKVKEFEPLHVPKLVEPKICLSRLVPTLYELKSSPMTTRSNLGLNLKIHPK